MTERELAQRYYRVYAEQLRRGARASGQPDPILEVADEVVAAFGGDGHFLTQVVGMGHVGREHWDRIEAWYGDRTGSYEAAVCPLERPESPGELVAYGFTSFAWTRVSGRRTDDPPSVEADVHAEGDPEVWAQTLAAANVGGVELYRNMAGLEGGVLFFAEVEGETAGVSLLLETEDGAYLSCGGVRPEYRGRGLHAAMIAARLRHLGLGKLAFFEADNWTTSGRNGARAGFIPVIDNLLLRKSLRR
ncbi:GNAT family N-acetyltransferase [bacterium]|nr:MAG: GNAT family N-acetyltransferase [bacterium]